MIETRFGLKYKMPHSLVHIVDNSQYNGPLPVITAEDPSLLASIVVTGAPMGADNKMITINRSDVLGVAYAMANLSTDDIKRYGQGVTYAGSLIEQGSPVRFMRVTPEDSTYAVSSLVVQWRIDGTDNKLHVRFKVKDWPEDLQRDRFKNTARVNEALVKYFKVDNAETDSQGTWTQRSFINFIAAGRGSVYNYMANAINMTNQAKRPANVRYEFDTIDTRTNQVCERFFASLMNVNNKDRTDAIDSVNTTVAKRLEGSSITVPYVNDAAVRELYDIYMKHYKNMLDIVEVDEFVTNAYKAMNINIFDMIFGNYIYNGTDTSTKMPFYQVDMLDNEIAKLEDSNLLYVLNNKVNDKALWNPNNPSVLYNKVLDSTYGITREGDSVHVGDLYLTTSGSNNSNPKISVITAINQYTGNVTSMTIPRVFPLDGYPTSTGTSPWTTLRKTVSGGGKASVIISTIVNDITEGAATDAAKSKTVEKYINANTITDSAVVAATRYDATTGNVIQGFDLYTVEVVTSTNPATGQTTKDYVLHYMDPKFYYEMLDRESHSGGLLGTGNAMGFWYTTNDGVHSDAAWNRPGATVVVQETSGNIKVNKIYVNSYERTSADDAKPTANRILVSDAAVHGIIGTPPTTVNLTDDLMGSQFDVKVYNNSNIDKWKVSGLRLDPDTSISNSVRFDVDDRFYIAIDAYVNGIEAGSSNDPEKYTINTAAEMFVVYWTQHHSDAENFLSAAPPDWDTGYVNYLKYDATSKRIVGVATMTKLTEEPASFDPTAYYKSTPAGYVKGSTGNQFADFDWYSADPTTAPTFTPELNVLSSAMTNGWNAGKDSYSDSVDDSPCKTIITVKSVDSESGKITGITMSKTGAYINANEASILNLLTKGGDHIKAVYITANPEDPKFAVKPEFALTNFKVVEENSAPVEIKRYTITGSLGSLFRIQNDPTIVPSNYYSDTYGINPTTEVGGIRMSGGSTGFFDNTEMSEIEFKWRYSALLVKAFRGEIDPRIQSPTRCPAKFMFDAGYNTIVGSTILPYLTYTPGDIINASIIFTEDEKEEILFHPEIIAGLKYEDIDVKQAMYDLMIYRCYQGIPEDKRPIGPGSGLSLHLDSGVTDANTAMLVNTSFAKRFDNPNASWDIGGWVDVETGMSFTFTKQIVDNLIRHCRTISINKPYTGSYSAISPDRYTSYFPDVDTTDWELRELLYNSGGNAWIMGQDGSLTRRSQRTLLRDADTSDLLQESNMRTLSQLTYLLQNKIDSYLLEYNDDAVIKTLSDECNNIFSNWVGNLVDALEITFTRDINIDGGEILICYCNVTFRGLILRVPIIVNVNRREYNS